MLPFFAQGDRSLLAILNMMKRDALAVGSPDTLPDQERVVSVVINQ